MFRRHRSATWRRQEVAAGRTRLARARCTSCPSLVGIGPGAWELRRFKRVDNLANLLLMPGDRSGRTSSNHGKLEFGKLPCSVRSHANRPREEPRPPNCRRCRTTSGATEPCRYFARRCPGGATVAFGRVACPRGTVKFGKKTLTQAAKPDVSNSNLRIG